MAHKVTQITRCSNAEEELMNYAEEADPPSGFLNARLPQEILGWNQLQFIDFKEVPHVQSNVKKRRLSVMVRGKNTFLGHGCQQKDGKEQLKFKLKHYKEQVLQSICILDVSNECTLVNASNQDPKQICESASKTNDLSKNKKHRNFSISQPKHKTIKSDITFETLMSKTSRTLVNTKQKVPRPAKMSFLPVTADFYLYEEQQKLSLKLKQYIKKCSPKLDL